MSVLPCHHAFGVTAVLTRLAKVVFCRASQGQKDLQSELLAVSTKLSKVSAEASSAGSASEAAAHARNILCAKLAECQQTVQAQREAGQRLQETQAATEKILRHDMQRCMAERSQQRYA